MKKAALLLAFLAIIGVQAAFFVPLAHADSILTFGQGQRNATSTLGNNGNSMTASVYMGNGFTGSSTGAVLNFRTVGQSNQNPTAQISFSQYSDSGYTTNVGTCGFSTNMAGDNDGPVDLSIFDGSSGVGCTLDPANYVKVAILLDAGIGQWGTTMKYMYGANVNLHGWTYCLPSQGSLALCQGSASTTFFPYFAFVGNGFTLSPTASSTSLQLSGASAFCSAQFGSSTSFGTDIAASLCTVVGFLFIPSSESIDAFTSFSTDLQETVPFSYYYDFASILNGSAASSSSNFSVLSLDLRGTGVGSTTAWATVLPSSFNYLSSTTITAYVPETLYNLLFLLMRSAIWIAVLFHIYRRLIPQHVTHA